MCSETIGFYMRIDVMEILNKSSDHLVKGTIRFIINYNPNGAREC